MTDNVFKQCDHRSPTTPPSTHVPILVQAAELDTRVKAAQVLLLEEHCRAHVAAYTILFLDDDLPTDDEDEFDYGSEQESCWGPGQNGETWGSDI